MGLFGDILGGALNTMNESANKAKSQAAGMEGYSDRRLFEEYAKAVKTRKLFLMSSISQILQRRGYDKDEIEEYAKIYY